MLISFKVSHSANTEFGILPSILYSSLTLHNWIRFQISTIFSLRIKTKHIIQLESISSLNTPYILNITRKQKRHAKIARFIDIEWNAYFVWVCCVCISVYSQLFHRKLKSAIAHTFLISYKPQYIIAFNNGKPIDEYKQVLLEQKKQKDGENIWSKLDFIYFAKFSPIVIIILIFSNFNSILQWNFSVLSSVIAHESERKTQFKHIK